MVDPVPARIHAVGVDAVDVELEGRENVERAGFPLDVRQQFSFGHCCQRRVEGPLQCLSKETEGRRFTVQDVLKKGRGAVRRDCRTSSSSRERRQRFTAKHPSSGGTYFAACFALLRLSHRPTPASASLCPRNALQSDAPPHCATNHEPASELAAQCQVTGEYIRAPPEV